MEHLKAKITKEGKFSESCFTKKMHRVTSLKTMAKMHKLDLELLSHTPYSPDPAPSKHHLFSELKKKIRGNKFGSDEEVIVETEAYFEGKYKSL